MDFKNIKRDEAENFGLPPMKITGISKYVKTKKVEDNTEDNAGGPSGNAPKPGKRENVALGAPRVRLGYEPGEEIHAG